MNLGPLTKQFRAAGFEKSKRNVIYILRDILNSHRQTPRQRVQHAERPKLSGSALSSQGAAVGARPFAVVVRSPAGPPRLILTGRPFCRCVCRAMMNETHTAWLGNFGPRTRTCRFCSALAAQRTSRKFGSLCKLNTLTWSLPV